VSRGLYGKYNVTKRHGPTDPEAQYFVLRLDTDPIALAAARFYAAEVMDENPQLAHDLADWCDAIEQGMKLGRQGHKE
jgi:hypothetical protein